MTVDAAVPPYLCYLYIAESVSLEKVPAEMFELAGFQAIDRRQRALRPRKILSVN